jgi:hypothetical protein
VALAITATSAHEESEQSKAGFGVNISVVKANVGADGTIKKSGGSTDQSTHRVSFSIPVYLGAHFRQQDALAEDLPFLERVLEREGLAHPMREAQRVGTGSAPE